MIPEQYNFHERTRFIIKLGRALHDSGATSDPIERDLRSVTTRQLPAHALKVKLK